LAHNHRTDNFENLIRDSVLFNVTYIELQNRASRKSSYQMILLTWVSAFIAVASLIIAGLSYVATESNNEWQQKQLKLLKTISEHTSPKQNITPNIATPKKSSVPIIPTTKLPSKETSKHNPTIPSNGTPNGTP
jgi:hypothetical protein